MARCGSLIQELEVDVENDSVSIYLYCPILGLGGGLTTTCDNMAAIEAEIEAFTTYAHARHEAMEGDAHEL